MNAISITFPRRWPWCAALLLMALSCKGSETAAPPTTGSIRVTAATGGTDLDPDGYTVALQGDTLSGTGSSSQPIAVNGTRSEEHTSELQSHSDLVCRLLLEKKKIFPNTE